jgi:hypothetical protein
MSAEKVEKKVTVDDLIKKVLPEKIIKDNEHIRDIEAKKRKKSKKKDLFLYGGKRDI